MSAENETPITELVDGFLAEQRQLAAAQDGLLTYEQSVQAFIVTADWLAAEHMPTLITLITVAKKLDLEVTASMVAQFGVTFRDLRSQAPGAGAKNDDPLEQQLRESGR